MWVDMVSLVLRKFLTDSLDDTWMPDQSVCSKFNYDTLTSTHRDISDLKSKGRNTKLGTMLETEICLHIFLPKESHELFNIVFCAFL